MDIDIHQRVVTSHTTLGAYHPDTMVVAVGDVDRAVCGNLCAVRTVKSGLGRWAAVSVSAEPAARDGGHEIGGAVYSTDRVILGVGDDDVTLCVAAYPLGAGPGGGECVSAVAGVA